jgi:hypothetical protein
MSKINPTQSEIMDAVAVLRDYGKRYFKNPDKHSDGELVGAGLAMATDWSQDEILKCASTVCEENNFHGMTRILDAIVSGEYWKNGYMVHVDLTPKPIPQIK